MTQNQQIRADRSSAKTEYLHADLTHEIIGGFYKVYNYFGYGFSESGYRRALCVELRRRGLLVEEEVVVEMVYFGVVVGTYRADIIVEGKVIVEAKAGANLDPSSKDQVLNYLSLTKLQVGLVLHFGPRPAVKRLISTQDRLEDITPAIEG